MINRSSQTDTTRIEAKPPSQLDPLLAEIGMKRITNQILLHWGTEVGDVYMNSLLINDREHLRAGFPPHVSKAIFALIKLNEAELQPHVGTSAVEPHSSISPGAAERQQCLTASMF